MFSTSSITTSPENGNDSKNDGRFYLDLLSTSQKSEPASETCAYSSPFFALRRAGKLFYLWQGCCNHWDCPRCGQMRARKEYGRIVEGCRTLSEQHELHFITLTCRGKDLSLSDAEEGYGKWTNRLFTALRYDAKKRGLHFAYAQVTERQKRGHPHSHVLTTYYPDDIAEGTKITYKNVRGCVVSEEKPCLVSEYLKKRCVSAGLGEQYDISRVRDHEAASRYVAKYMFKDSMFQADLWRKNWRRVRYSQNFPKLPETENSEAFALIKTEDWQRLAREAAVIRVEGAATREAVDHYLQGTGILIKA